ncbi:hypothetical protein [Sphingomonas sp. Ag1]|uniref:hypothetical protein n=1 Tax=Sphingomonas sp. Ag1 TaxID=1642949 RepID=UPI00062154F1|nr:hypothetical protein [Sphingomonas sp. Ag1]KKI22758.1 hypothetical protein XM50_00225 [Sphingomonas sp. Ag1]
MAGIYDTFANAASQLLTGPLGGKGKLRRKSGGGYDDNGEPVPVTQRDVPVACVVKTKEVWNAGAYLGSKLVAVLDNKVEPQPNDELIVGARTYTVVEVAAKAPAGTVITYEVVLG